MSAHTPWPADKYEAPVWIDLGRSATEILDPTYLSVLKKAPDIDIIGIMLDGDSKPRSRYASIRSHLLDVFPSLPEELPAGGAITDGESKRLGVWIMPDNASEGCLETFLRYLVPSELQPIWEYAAECADGAKTRGAPCRDVHEDKARIYTFLAWNDPPGQNPGVALAKKVLDPRSSSAAVFVKWFKALYGLP
jgi:hypothetical protein